MFLEESQIKVFNSYGFNKDWIECQEIDSEPSNADIVSEQRQILDNSARIRLGTFEKDIQTVINHHNYDRFEKLVEL